MTSEQLTRVKLLAFNLCGLPDEDREAIHALLARLESLERMREAVEGALVHIRELEDAWMRGAIRECDGKGGMRSNRNIDIRVALEAALAALTTKGPTDANV